MTVRSDFTKPRQRVVTAKALIMLMAVVSIPSEGFAGIIWSGDFNAANFLKYHTACDKNKVVFRLMPQYGAPVPQNLASGQTYVGSGDGSLLSLVQSPTRGGKYAAKFTVKNSANGSEPADCDVAGNTCVRRRTQLDARVMLSDCYNALPYMSERWLSISVYLPQDFESAPAGWGPLIFGHKPRNENGLSGLFNIDIQGSGWKINHRWSPVENPTKDDIPWQQTMYYGVGPDGKLYPRVDNWPDGLRDFPDVNASYAALNSLNKGGWTDWVAHIKYDARGSKDGGTGFLTVWKREDSEPWVKVLHIVPKITTRGGMTFDHGIGYNSPPTATNNGGFGINVGPYLAKETVWNNSRNMVMYIDNVKIGDAKAAFGEMSPDGSSPETQQPMAPEITRVD